MSLDTSGFNINDKYSVVIEISDGSTTIPVDFMIKFVDSIELPHINFDDLDECVFAGLNYNYPLIASIPSDPSIELTWNVLSVLPTNVTTETSENNTLSLLFSPSSDQIGEVYVINLSVYNPNNGATSYLNITFTVKQNSIENIIDIFNCAIKNVVVECERLNAIEKILCMKEKQLLIWKNGQQKLLEYKKKYTKK